MFNVILHLISTLRTIWIESNVVEKSLGVLMGNKLNMNQQRVLVQWHPSCIMKTVASRLRKVILRLSSSLECLFLGLTSPGQDGGRHIRVRPTKVYKLRDWIMFHVRRGWECVVCLAWRKEAYRGPNSSPQILTGCFLRSQSKALHKGMWWDDKKDTKPNRNKGDLNWVSGETFTQQCQPCSGSGCLEKLCSLHLWGFQDFTDKALNTSVWHQSWLCFEMEFGLAAWVILWSYPNWPLCVSSKDHKSLLDPMHYLTSQVRCVEYCRAPQMVLKHYL